MGGLGEDDLRAAVTQVADGYGETAVVIELPDRTIETTVAELGGEVDVDATVDQVMDARRDQSVVTRPFAWFGSLFSDDELGVELDLADATLREKVAELEGDTRIAPTEPVITFTQFGYIPSEGIDGTGIDPVTVEEQVVDAAGDGAVGSITVQTEPKAIPPRFTDDEAQALADEATALVQSGIQVSAEGAVTDVPTEILGPWITSRPGEEELELFVVREKITEDLPGLLGNVGQAPVDAGFTVENGVPVVIPSQPGTGCCAEGSGQQVLDALEAGESSVELELTAIEPVRNTEWAEGLGIVEEITLPDEGGCSQFNADPCRRTTHHSCCASRVTNIQLMADLTRGYVIEPGGYFSPNEIVGPRTAENGFAVAGAIENGEHVDVVGGGVSQFATTTFNAAF
ncbi:MAG: VanW family protein, partial [Actinomycetota bacterium]